MHSASVPTSTSTTSAFRLFFCPRQDCRQVPDRHVLAATAVNREQASSWIRTLVSGQLELGCMPMDITISRMNGRPHTCWK